MDLPGKSGVTVAVASGRAAQSQGRWSTFEQLWRQLEETRRGIGTLSPFFSQSVRYACATIAAKREGFGGRSIAGISEPALVSPGSVVDTVHD